MATNNSRPDLYALLVGVNQYPHLPSKYQLSGCLKDVAHVKAYLESDTNIVNFNKVALKTLQDDQAVKKKIVDAFDNHLGQAREGDVVLFYYSGHGMRERTDIELLRAGEVDGRLGGVICSDFSNNPADTVLSNKEFRYLIHQLTGSKAGQPKVHAVMIFDCCHSGSNSRSVPSGEMTIAPKQIKYASIGGRPVEGFIFSRDKAVKKKIEETITDEQKHSLEEVLPQGDHIMLAACREIELAWQPQNEVSYFTKALVDVLQQHKGRIGYHELYTRVHNRMKFNISMSKEDVGQTPQVYVRSLNPADRYNLFLTNQPNEKPAYATVEISKTDHEECRIDFGYLHGIPLEKKRAVKVHVFPAGKEQEKFEVKIDKVFLTHSTVKSDRMLKEDVVYQAKVEGTHQSPMSLYVDQKGEKTGIHLLIQRIENNLKKSSGQLYRLVDDEETADIVLRAKDQRFVITYPFDPDRPLVQPLPYKAGKEAFNNIILDTLSRFVYQIGEWWLLKGLEHVPEPKFPDSLRSKTTMYPVELRAFQYLAKGKEKRLYPNKENQFILQPTPGEPVWVRFEIENFSSDLLACSLAYMTSTFGFWIDPDHPNRDYTFMNAAQKILKRKTENKRGEIVDGTWRSKGIHPIVNGKKVETENKYIDFGGWNDKYLPHIIKHNWEGEANHFKLIVSRKPFEIKSFHRSSLPEPLKPFDEEKMVAGKSMPSTPPLPEDYWELRTFEIYTVNPEYK